MDKSALIQKLNVAISLELCAIIQYNQYSRVLMGADRRVWHEFFEGMSDGGLKDARKFGTKVVALGGMPTVEPAPVRQASDIGEMLSNALEHEQALVRAYTEALEVAHDHPAYRNLLEEQIQHEHDEVEEIMIYLNRVQKQQATMPGAKRGSKAG